MGLIPLVIVGAGGHGREMLDVVEAVNAERPTYEFLGFVDRGPVDAEVLARRGAPWLGDLDALDAAPGGLRYVIGIGSASARREVDERLTELGRAAATLVHPQASIGGDVELAPGVVLAAGARVTTNVRIGRHSQLNANAAVHHDGRVGDHVTISPGVTVCGTVTLGDGAFLGAGATVNPGVTIGARAIVGAGAVVTADVREGVTVAGVPARVIR